MAKEQLICLTRIGLWQGIFYNENTKKARNQGVVSEKQKVFFKTDIVFFTKADAFFTMDGGEIILKWFKHVSDSLNDPFIFSLMKKHGGDGYLVFFGTLEIYSREFKTEDEWKLVVNLSYFQKNLLISSSKIKKILSDIWKWEVSFNGDTVSVFIPKFRELLDESTLKKLRDKEKSFRNGSGIIPKTATTEADKEVDIDKELKAIDEPFRLPLKEEISESSKPKTEQSIESLSKHLYDEKIFPDVFAFKNLCLKHKANLRAVVHTLSRCIITKPTNPWAYCVSIMKKEDGNFNARDYEKASY